MEFHWARSSFCLTRGVLLELSVSKHGHLLMPTSTQGLQFPFRAVKSAETDLQTTRSQAKSPRWATTLCQPCLLAGTRLPWPAAQASSVMWQQSRLLSPLDPADFLGTASWQSEVVSCLVLKGCISRKLCLVFFLCIKSSECFVTLSVNKGHRKYNFTEIRDLQVG